MPIFHYYQDDLESFARKMRAALRPGKWSAFVGAGASADYGLPTFPQLIQELLSYCEETNLEIQPESLARVIDLMHKNSSKAYESLLSGLSRGDQLKIVSIVQKRLSENLIPEARTSSATPSAIFRIIHGNPGFIITTNYDKCIESEISRSPIAKLSSGRMRVWRHFHDACDSRAGLNHDAPSLTVLKLHGCLDIWTTQILRPSRHNPLYKRAHPYSNDEPIARQILRDILKKTQCLVIMGSKLSHHEIFPSELSKAIESSENPSNISVFIMRSASVKKRTSSLNSSYANIHVLNYDSSTSGHSAQTTKVLSIAIPQVYHTSSTGWEIELPPEAQDPCARSLGRGHYLMRGEGNTLSLVRDLDGDKEVRLDIVLDGRPFIDKVKHGLRIASHIETEFSNCSITTTSIRERDKLNLLFTIREVHQK